MNKKILLIAFSTSSLSLLNATEVLIQSEDFNGSTNFVEENTNYVETSEEDGYNYDSIAGNLTLKDTSYASYVKGFTGNFALDLDSVLVPGETFTNFYVAYDITINEEGSGDETGAIVALRFFDSDSNALNLYTQGSGNLTAGTYADRTFSFVPSAEELEDIDSWRYEIQTAGTQLELSNFTVDNLRFVAVASIPEPSSFAMLSSLMCLGLISRRNLSSKRRSV